MHSWQARLVQERGGDGSSLISGVRVAKHRDEPSLPLHAPFLESVPGCRLVGRRSARYLTSEKASQNHGLDTAVPGRTRTPPLSQSTFSGYNDLSLSAKRSLYRIQRLCVYVCDVVNVAESTGWCERLYRAKAPELILYGRALGLSHAEAEDVLQETFVALMGRVEPPNQPEHYCVRSFRNRALNYRRSLWRRLTRELESKRWFERSPGDSPAERAAMRALATLPQDQREAIVLKIWHEHTFDEIGELLGISPNTAAGRYRYGLQKLRAQLKGQAYERDERFGEAIAFVEAAPPLKGA